MGYGGYSRHPDSRPTYCVCVTLPNTGDDDLRQSTPSLLAGGYCIITQLAGDQPYLTWQNEGIPGSGGRGLWRCMGRVLAQTGDPGCRGNRVRCYGASGDDIGSISGLLNKRWLHRRRCQTQPMEPIDAQAEKAQEAGQRPEPFAYTLRS